jgi:hypothetical protein
MTTISTLNLQFAGATDTAAKIAFNSLPWISRLFAVGSGTADPTFMVAERVSPEQLQIVSPNASNQGGYTRALTDEGYQITDLHNVAHFADTYPQVVPVLLDALFS